MRAGESSEVGARKNTDAEGDAFRVIEKPLFRRRSRSVTLAETPPPAKPEPVRRPAKIAQQLARVGPRRRVHQRFRNRKLGFCCTNS